MMTRDVGSSIPNLLPENVTLSKGIGRIVIESGDFDFFVTFSDLGNEDYSAS